MSNVANLAQYRKPRYLAVPFEPTNRGRLFFVGDLNGEWGLFGALLRSVDFDSEFDTVLQTGNIVGRGPNSMHCLRLLNDPWFHAVKGEHELRFVTNVERLAAGEAIEDPDGAMNWMIRAYAKNPAEMHAFSRIVDALPSILVQPDPRLPGGRFNVVHGALSDGASMMRDTDIDWLLTKPQNARMASVLESKLARVKSPYRIIAPGISGRMTLASRGVRDAAANEAVTPWLDGLSLTLCGHTSMHPFPQLALSHLSIDTGGGLSRADEAHSLSMVTIMDRSDECIMIRLNQVGHNSGDNKEINLTFALPKPTPSEGPFNTPLKHAGSHVA
jgi:serine/threonine protein phosphatase 1